MNLKDPSIAIEKSMKAFSIKNIQERLPKASTITPLEYQQILIGFNDAVVQNYFKSDTVKVANDLKKAKEIFYNTILYPTNQEANEK